MYTRVRKLSHPSVGALHMIGLDGYVCGATFADFEGPPQRARDALWGYIEQARCRNAGLDTYWSRRILPVCVKLDLAVLRFPTAPVGSRVSVTGHVLVVRTPAELAAVAQPADTR